MAGFSLASAGGTTTVAGHWGLDRSGFPPYSWPLCLTDAVVCCPRAPLGWRHSFRQPPGILVAAELPGTHTGLCQGRLCPLPGGQPTSNGHEGTSSTPLPQFRTTVKDRGSRSPRGMTEAMVTAALFHLSLCYILLHFLPPRSCS